MIDYPFGSFLARDMDGALQAEIGARQIHWILFIAPPCGPTRRRLPLLTGQVADLLPVLHHGAAGNPPFAVAALEPVHISHIGVEHGRDTRFALLSSGELRKRCLSV